MQPIERGARAGGVGGCLIIGMFEVVVYRLPDGLSNFLTFDFPKPKALFRRGKAVDTPREALHHLEGGALRRLGADTVPTSWVQVGVYSDAACSKPSMYYWTIFGMCVEDYNPTTGAPLGTSTIETVSVSGTTVTLTTTAYSDAACTTQAGSPSSSVPPIVFNSCVPSDSGTADTAYAIYGLPVTSNPIGLQPETLVGSLGYTSAATCANGGSASASSAYGHVNGFCRSSTCTTSGGSATPCSVTYTATSTGYTTTTYSDTACETQTSTSTQVYSASTTCQSGMAQHYDGTYPVDNSQAYQTQVTITGTAGKG